MTILFLYRYYKFHEGRESDSLFIFGKLLSDILTLNYCNCWYLGFFLNLLKVCNHKN